MQNSNKISVNGDSFKLKNSSFEIHLRDISSDNQVYIFISYDDGFGKKIKVPCDMKDVSFLLPGTGMAITVDRDNSIPLLLCSKYSHNHITEDRRKQNGKDIIIKVNGIYDVDKYAKGILNTIIFVDRNRNNRIEKDEINIFKINIK